MALGRIGSRSLNWLGVVVRVVPVITITRYRLTHSRNWAIGILMLRNSRKRHGRHYFTYFTLDSNTAFLPAILALDTVQLRSHTLRRILR